MFKLLEKLLQIFLVNKKKKNHFLKIEENHFLKIEKHSLFFSGRGASQKFCFSFFTKIQQGKSLA